MHAERALAWNTAIQTAGKIVSTAIGVVVVGLMTRLLGTVGFGYYSTANAYFSVFAIILDFGLSVTIIQMLGEHLGNEAYERRITSATLTLRIVTAAVLLTLGAFACLLMPYPMELKMAIFALWASFFFSTLNQIVIGVQQRHLKMHVVAIAEVAGRLVLLAGVLYGMFAHWGLIPIVITVSIGGFVNFLINAWVATRYASLGWNWDPAFWKELTRKSWPIGVSIIFNLLYYKADTLILSYVRPFTEVGLYGAAYRVLDVLTTLPFMYCGVLLPMIANAWAKKDHAKFQHLLRQSYVAMLFLTAPMFFGGLVLGTQAMRVVAGSDFVGSGPILKILLLACSVIFVGTVSSHAIVAVNKQREMMKWYIVIALVTCALYLWLIPIYGMYAAAWLTVFSEACVAFTTSWISLRTSGTTLELAPYLKILAAAALMALAVLPFQNLWLPIPLVVGIVVYCALIYAFGVISPTTLKGLLAFRQGIPPADESTWN